MRRLLATLFCAAMLFGATSAQAASPADAYPSGPISLVVCYTPGGATDLQARLSALVAQDPKYFGQPIVILNKPGAGGMTGWNWIMERGSKDGLTMTAYNMPHFIAQSIVNKTKFSVDTFEPLGNWGADPAVLIVPKDSKFKNVADLVAFAKENPGKVTINGAGLYVGHHIATQRRRNVPPAFSVFPAPIRRPQPGHRNITRQPTLSTYVLPDTRNRHILPLSRPAQKR